MTKKPSITGNEMAEKKDKLWDVKRTIVEEFQVVAKTKQEALMVEQAPHKITIIKESAKISKD